MQLLVGLELPCRPVRAKGAYLRDVHLSLVEGLLRHVAIIRGEILEPLDDVKVLPQVLDVQLTQVVLMGDHVVLETVPFVPRDYFRTQRASVDIISRLRVLESQFLVNLA